ncbi:unnamed protein product [Acanthoscelides obtectus]|uniref:Uncharacterized protein n=1 Tax=Acanthoscelides obtectus TaxID=200917 RepID=A0A9P0LXJ9_ACAOB|nr:unnamed protein product [Acanthoscelides obtectus]CAK1670893.1 hypothetical protein AOBTE_LOCUS27900 [Acanthoscelides obtectus]
MEITQISYDHAVNFTCAVTEVYPTPKLFMYKDFRDDQHNSRKDSKSETRDFDWLRIEDSWYRVREDQESFVLPSRQKLQEIWDCFTPNFCQNLVFQIYIINFYRI